MSSTTTIAKHYARILAQWPKDALRPNLPFTLPIERRAALYGVKPTPSPSASPSSTSTPTPASASSKGSPIASSPSPSPVQRTPAQETAQINALFSLLNNRYANKYPLSADVLRPKSNPEHYERLLEEIERAPGKTWWQAKVDEWKMKIRWS